MSAEPGKKPTPWPNPRITSDLERVGVACAGIRGPRLGRRAHGEGSDRPRRRRWRKPGRGARFGATLSQDVATLSQDESRLAGGATGRAAPLGRDRREGRQAGGQAGKARARTAVGSRNGHRPHPSAGEQAAQALAQARRQRRRAFGRECGPHNAGRMRATQCGTLQTCEQTGRWERTGQVMCTTAPRTTRTRSRARHGHQ